MNDLLEITVKQVLEGYVKIFVICAKYFFFDSIVSFRTTYRIKSRPMSCRHIEF
jgi:hypothetical protein